jgi:hypothetical protein
MNQTYNNYKVYGQRYPGFSNPRLLENYQMEPQEFVFPAGASSSPTTYTFNTEEV